jgi:hypothetical protein
MAKITRARISLSGLLKDERFCLVLLGTFLVLLSLPILRDLHRLPTKLNADSYQHLSFAFSYYEAVWNHGELPLWNPYFGGGIPWAGYLYNPGISPWGLIYGLAGDVAGVKIALVITLVLGGLGVYGVARRVALLGPAFSLFAALLFLSSNWMTARLNSGNYNEFSSYFWLFAVLCFHEFLRGRILGLLFPVYFVIVFNPAKYTALTVVLAGLIIVLFSRAYQGGRRFAVLMWLTGALIGVLLAMPKILPMIELFRLNLVDVQALDALGGYTPAEILQRLINPRLGGTGGFAVGWLALCLSAAGIFFRWREAREWIVLLFISCVLALGAGAPFPIPTILSHVPIFSTMGDYGKYFNIYILSALCILAAFGLEAIYAKARDLCGWLSERTSWKPMPVVFLLLAALALLPLARPALKAFDKAFNSPQPHLARGEFYQVSYRRLIGTIRKGRGALRKDDQYNNVRRNIGTITWSGNIVLPENAVPKLIIDKQGEHANPDYIGEAALVGPNANRGKISRFILDFNTMKLVYSSPLPQTILLNFNFNDGWSSSAGQVEERDGLLAINVDPANDKEVVLRFADPKFTLGCYLAVLAAICWAFLYAYMVRRAWRPSLSEPRTPKRRLRPS